MDERPSSTTGVRVREARAPMAERLADASVARMDDRPRFVARFVCAWHWQAKGGCDDRCHRYGDEDVEGGTRGGATRWREENNSLYFCRRNKMTLAQLVFLISPTESMMCIGSQGLRQRLPDHTILEQKRLHHFVNRGFAHAAEQLGEFGQQGLGQ